LEGLEA